MKKYKPIDAIYEDIYDFDDINGKSFDTPRSGKTFVNIVSSANRTWIKDERVHLPHIVSRPPGHTHGTELSHEKPSVERGYKDWHTGRQTPHVPRQPHKDHSTDLVGSVKLPQINASYDRHTRQKNLEPVDADALYRSLMEGVHDKSMLEKSPQVLEYERRNKIKHEGCEREIFGKKSHILIQADEVFVRSVGEYEKPIKQKPVVHNDPRRIASTHLQTSVYQPSPPTAPKPETSQKGFNKRRKLLYASSQLDQDISIHNPPKPYHKPRPPTAEVEIDYDHDVQEALRVEQELDLLHKKLEKQMKTNMAIDVEILRPTTAAEANSNLPGCSTPCPIPIAAVPYKSVGPVKAWNGDTAKRGLGFRSKIKREQPGQRNLDINRIPDKIRKEMKKYFG